MGYNQLANAAAMHLPLQGNIDDVAPGGYSHTSVGSPAFASNAAAAWLPQCIDFDGTDDAISINSSFLCTYDNCSISFWYRRDSLNNTYPGLFTLKGTSGHKISAFTSSEANYSHITWSRWSGGSFTNNRTSQEEYPSLDVSQWHHYTMVVRTSVVDVYLDGVLTTPRPPGGLANPTANSAIGSLDGQWYGNSKMADFMVHNGTQLPSGDIAELIAGPEPKNTVVPVIPSSASVGSALTLTTAASYDSQGNGSATITYSWYSYTNTSGAGETLLGTGTSYTPVSGDVGKFIRVRSSASNPGGTDTDENKFSNYTGAVSASSGVTGTMNAVETATDTFAASGFVVVTGTMAANETATDTFAGSGFVVVTGTMAAVETATDAFAGSGFVIVTGTMNAVETGTDTFAGTGEGGVVSGVSGTMNAVETAQDTFAANGFVVVTGTMAANETATDTFSANGFVTVTGTMAAIETGTDTFAGTGDGGIVPGAVTGTMAAIETAQDTFASNGFVIVSGTMALFETGTDFFFAYETVVTVDRHSIKMCKSRRVTMCKSRTLRMEQ